MTRLRSHLPSLGARFVWHTFWRKARRGDEPYDAESDLAAIARSCLVAREFAAEEAERLETQPGRVGYVFRHRSSLAWRALARRGWTLDDVRHELRARGLDVYGGIVTIAVEAIRADRALAGA